MSKHNGGLWPQVTSFDNLLLAFHKAALGKRSKPSVASFEFDLESNLLALRDELRSGAYRPGAYDSFQIHEPKRRLISAAPFRDRVVHHALINVVEPIYERKFIYDSYANRNRNTPDNRNDNIGFRCARPLSPGQNSPRWPSPPIAQCAERALRASARSPRLAAAGGGQANTKEPGPLRRHSPWGRAPTGWVPALGGGNDGRTSRWVPALGDGNDG